MKKLLIAVAIIALSGCQAMQQRHVNDSPAQFYRPDGASESWKITGTLTLDIDRMWGNHKRQLNVNINGQPVIEGFLSPMYSGELSGQYENKRVDSICSGEQKNPNWIDVRCLILIDNQRAATLSF